MALGEFRLFQFKSKKQREIEEREYAAWAFPHGDVQRERLSELILDLFNNSKTKNSLPIHLATFLTCKELYERELKDSESSDEAVDKMINTLKSYGQLIKKSEMPMYLALVLFDASIDDNCKYPPVDEIRVKAQELTDLRKGKKW